MAGNLRFSNPKTLAKPPGYSYVVEATGPNRVIYPRRPARLGYRQQVRRRARRFPRAVRAGVREHDVGAQRRRRALERRGQDQQLSRRYRANMGAFREVRDRYLNAAAPPASTTIGVPALARPGGLFEIEAIAVLPAKAAANRRSPPPSAARSRRADGNESEQAEHRQQHGERPQHVAEEARHLDAALVGDGRRP